MTICGLMLAHNLVEFEYPWFEAFSTVEPICDKFIFNEFDSRDETYLRLLDLQRKFPNKIEVFKRQWRGSGHPLFFDEYNFCIEKCECDWYLIVEADEIFTSKALSLIKERLIFDDDVDFYRFGVVTFWSNKFDKVMKNLQFAYRMGRRSICLSKTMSSGEALFIADPTKDRVRVIREDMIFHYTFTQRPEVFLKRKIYAFRNLFRRDRIDLEKYDIENFYERKMEDWLQKEPNVCCNEFVDVHPAVMNSWIRKQREGI